MGPVEIHSLPKQGHSSRAWSVNAGGERFVAKLVLDQRRYVEPGLRVAATVHAGGVPTGPPVPTAGGDLCVDVPVDERACTLTLLRFMAGQPLDTASSGAPWIAGSLLGRVHAILLRDSKRTSVPAALLDWCESYAASNTHVDQVDATNALAALRSLERRRKLTFAVVYGDPSPEILVEDSFVAVIDWGTPSWGPLLHDVACWMSFVDAERSTRRAVRFLEAYRRSLPLGREELRALPLLHSLTRALRLTPA